MGRTKHSFTREEPFRDCRLIVIAVEGAKTEEKYFVALTESYLNKRVKVVVLPNNNNKSAPSYVLDNLEKYKDQNALIDDDNLYVVIDKDRWEEKSIATIAKQCHQKNFELILSNPCFELWIILHFQDLSLLSCKEKEEYTKNNKITKNRRFIESKIMEHTTSYNKSNPDFAIIIENVNTGISNAKKLDKKLQYRWQKSLGTRIYRIVEEIIKIQ